MAISELSRLPTVRGLTQEQIKAALFTYRLRGERIKEALLLNPGKVIVSPRQSGKTTALASYVMENFPNGVIMITGNKTSGEQLRRKLSHDYSLKTTFMWGEYITGNVSFISEYVRNVKAPIFADEICSLSENSQNVILRNHMFAGAVSTSYMLPGKECQDRCIAILP